MKTSISKSLTRLRPVLLLEVEDEATLGALSEQVKGLGYRCWRVETGLYDRANFNRRDDDIFAGRSALALVAVPEESDAVVEEHGTSKIRSCA